MPHRDVQAATLAAQADGFSTLADVAVVRALAAPEPPGQPSFAQR